MPSFGSRQQQGQRKRARLNSEAEERELQDCTAKNSHGVSCKQHTPKVVNITLQEETVTPVPPNIREDSLELPVISGDPATLADTQDDLNMVSSNHELHPNPEGDSESIQSPPKHCESLTPQHPSITSGNQIPSTLVTPNTIRNPKPSTPTSPQEQSKPLTQEPFNIQGDIKPVSPKIPQDPQPTNIQEIQQDPQPVTIHEVLTIPTEIAAQSPPTCLEQVSSPQHGNSKHLLATTHVEHALNMSFSENGPDEMAALPLGQAQTHPRQVPYNEHNTMSFTVSLYVVQY